MYAADFETATKEPTYVWAWGLLNVDTGVYTTGCTISEFIAFVKKNCKKQTIYFHNAWFDFQFIVSYLLEKGYQYSKVKASKTIVTMIDDMNKFYQAKIYFSTTNYIVIKDTQKIFNFKLEKIAKDFKLKYTKGEIDYDKTRTLPYIMTEEEYDYLKRDVYILGETLKIMQQMNITKLTIGGQTLDNFKNSIGKNVFSYYFPVIDCDAELREGYRGGFCMVNPVKKNKLLGKGIVLDVNSMYPYILATQLQPFDYPIYGDGEPVLENPYKLYIARIRVTYELKPGHIPTVQKKAHNIYTHAQYSISGVDEVMTMTNVDLELFKEHYIIHDIEYFGYWKFKGKTDLFSSYVNELYDMKSKAKDEGNNVLYVISKLFNNNIYGKFGQGTIATDKSFYLDDGVVKYELNAPEPRKPVYLPVAMFTTAYGRAMVIRAAQYNYDRWIYCDTDSCHLEGWDVPDNFEVDSFKLGVWDLETKFVKAKYMGCKCYMEETDIGKKIVKVAGLPDEAKEQVTFNNFEYGAIYHGKKQMKIVKGGAIIVDTDYTLKNRF